MVEKQAHTSASFHTPKAKKSAKKGQVLFKDDYHILTGRECPELFCKWVLFFLRTLHHIKDPQDYKAVDWDTFNHILIQIVAGEAKEVVKVTMLQLHPQKMTYTLGTYNLFTDGYVKIELSTVMAPT